MAPRACRRSADPAAARSRRGHRLGGADQAESLWHTARPDDIADLLAPSPLVVVKDAEHGATSYGSGGRTLVPAPPVEVVEPVGAGDAFAAGHLSAVLHDHDEPARLRLGRLTAAAALRTRDDVPVRHQVADC
ncbi:PfkB family carbohydrate kinase [Streptomyces phyllanthi]|uniref:PfkB family carbohydrate kinase n=1 Tax=Streptomyces phyllanthi TaxID=1803180 RepID=UPI002AD539A0|nr:PfkB family carbohydrate kinase [Streptomyces phyllanthi]